MGGDDCGGGPPGRAGGASRGRAGREERRWRGGGRRRGGGGRGGCSARPSSLTFDTVAPGYLPRSQAGPATSAWASVRAALTVRQRTSMARRVPAGLLTPGAVPWAGGEPTTLAVAAPGPAGVGKGPDR